MGEGLMTTFAAWPGWMTFIVVMAVIGPLMRFAFGGWARQFPHPPQRRLKGKRAAGEIARLDSALAERDVVIEDLQRRINELESRLDFTERLLATREAKEEPNKLVAHSA